MNTNSKYILLQAFTCGEYLVIFSYYTFYLGSYGLSNTTIGMLSSVFSLLAIVTTFLLGRVADKSPRFNWRTISLLIFGIIILLMASLFVISTPMTGALVFSLAYLLLSAGQPMINAAAFYYEEHGEAINFGIARGLGSLGYAAFSFALGPLSVRFGAPVIPVCGMVIGVLLGIILLWLPACKDYSHENNEPYSHTKEQPSGSSSLGFGALMLKYPAFAFMAAANLLLMTYHNMYNTYLIRIVESVGGNSNNLGIALAIAAIFELPTMLLASRIIKRFPAHLVLLLAPVGFLLRGLIFLAATNIFHIYIAQTNSLIGYAVFAAIGAYFTNECMEEQDKVTGQAILGMAVAASNIISSYLGGLLIDRYDYKVMLTVGAAIAIVGAVCVINGARIHAHNKGRSQNKEIKLCD